ncbi:MAG: hypothetical protein N0E44_02600 [Candidatus Thiodiazotropha lotti]|nr:hypothetical protein [Candidatus Thiodiazotropha lotti]MCW4218766.1 hypothetical protein [Candidatus Thiodiazotropha lotti]
MSDWEEHKAFKRRRQSGTANFYVDKSAAKSCLGQDPGMMLRAHRSALLKPVGKLTIEGIVKTHNDRINRLGYYELGATLSSEFIKQNVDNTILPGTGMIPALGEAAIRVGIDTAKDAVIDEFRDDFNQLLGDCINEVIGPNAPELLGNDATRDATIEKLGLKDVFKLTNTDLPSDGKAIAHAAAIERLHDAILAGHVETLMHDARQDTTISKLAENTTKVANDLTQFKVQVGNQFSLLKSNVEGMQKEIKANKKQIQSIDKRSLENEYAIDEITLILSETLPPESKRHMIVKGLVKVKDKDQALKQIDAQVKRKNEIKNTRHILDEGAALVNVLKNIGVDKSVYEPIEKGVSFGASIFNAVTAFQSGAYFGGLSALTSLFGQKSGAANAQLEKMLKKISDKLQEIDKKIDTVIKLQALVLESLDDIREAIVKMEANILENVLLNRKYIQAEFFNQLNAFRSMAFAKDGVRYIDVLRGVFPTYEILSKLNGVHKFKEEDQWKAANYLFGIIDRGASISRNFHLAGHQGVSNLQVRVDKDYAKLLQVYSLIVAHCKESNPQQYSKLDFATLLRASAVPMHKINDIDRYFYNAHSEPAIMEPELRYLSEGVFGELLYSVVIIDAVEALLNTHFIQCCLSPRTGEFMTLEEYLDQDEYITQGRFWLGNALRLLNVAIAQQALLSGGLMLPLILHLFEGVPHTPDDGDSHEVLKKQVIEAIRPFPLLQRNLVTYGVYYQAFLASGHTRFADRYGGSLATAVGTGDFADLEFFLGIRDVVANPDNQRRWIFKLDDGEKPCLELAGDLLIPLPPMEWMSPDSFIQLKQRNELATLVNFREHVIEHIQSYDPDQIFGFDGNPDNWELYNSTVVISAT